MLMNKLTEGNLPRKDRLNDLVVFLSLKYIIPAGAFDADRVKGIRCTIDSSGDLALVDGAHTLARKLQYESSPRAAVNSKTRNAVVLIEALPPFNRSKLESALAELAGLIKVFCGGKIRKIVLDKGKRTADI
jgi:DNA/RNA-binding domain of Phe-tRNA-synthetase-like protein